MLKNSPNKRSQRASFLIEVLSVLLLLSGLLYMTVPHTKNLKNSLLVKQELFSIDSALRKAHTLAVSEGKQIFFKVQKKSFSTTDYQKILVSKTVEMIEFTESSTHVTFYPTGTATPKKIDIKINNTKCSFTISLRSRIKTSCHLRVHKE